MRRAGGAVLLALILIGGYRWEWIPFLLTGSNPSRPPGDLVGIDRAPLRLRHDPLPEDFRLILEETARRMRHGESVAFVFGYPANGYSYAFYRGVQTVAPRRALLPLNLDDSRLTSHVRKADWITTWDHEVALSQFERVAQIGRGTILRKKE